MAALAPLQFPPQAGHPMVRGWGPWGWPRPPSPMPGMMWNSSLILLSTAVVMMRTRGKA